MTLGEKQRLFSQHVALLILHAYSEGYEVTLGHALRSPEEAERLGMRTSLHVSKLAIDLNLFAAGRYLTETESHRPLGEWWEEQHELCRWGGRFSKPDGNHYSFAHEGRA